MNKKELNRRLAFYELETRYINEEFDAITDNNGLVVANVGKNYLHVYPDCLDTIYDRNIIELLEQYTEGEI